MDEFQRRATINLNLLILRIARGQCVESYGGKEPYYPMQEAVGGLCRGSETEFLVEALATQAPTWLVQFPALVKREHREMVQRERRLGLFSNGQGNANTFNAYRKMTVR